MIEDTCQLGDNLWFIAGEMPADAMKSAESRKKA
jgi:hypothetical protein